LVLERLTLEYCAEQDRLRLAASVEVAQATEAGDAAESEVGRGQEQQEVRVFWLTQRLCGLLLPRLFSWLQTDTLSLAEQDDAEGEGRSELGFEANKPLSSQALALLAERQTAAQWLKSPVEPVEVPSKLGEAAEDLLETEKKITGYYEAPAGLLLGTLDIRVVEGFLTLLLPLPAGKRAQVSFTAQQLSQWLAVFYSGYCRAQWPMGIWPEWFVLAQQAPKPTTVALH